MEKENRIDNTERQQLITCPRKYYYRNSRNLFSKRGSTALRYGSAWHGCMEGFYGTIADKGWGSVKEGITNGLLLGVEVYNRESKKFDFDEGDYRSIANMTQCFLQYIDHFYFDEGLMEILETERVFKILMKPTEVEKKVLPGIKPWYFTGKIDLNVKLSGIPWILEFKTTGSYLEQQSQRLNRSPQILGYTYACAAYDILKEVPGGALISMHQITSRKGKSGDWGKLTVDFKRVPNTFSEMDLANWRLGFAADAYRLQQYLNHDFWPMRHSSCYQYGPCTYINLCEQHRPIGTEVIDNFFIDDDPWHVLQGSENILVEVEEEDNEKWNLLQQKALNWL